MEEQPEVIEPGKFCLGRLQDRARIRLELGGQRVDDVGLPAEVIVEVARADVELVGNLVDRRARRALLVEQEQAGDEDAILGVAFHGNNDGAIPGRFQRERKFLAIGNTP